MPEKEWQIALVWIVKIVFLWLFDWDSFLCLMGSPLKDSLAIAVQWTAWLDSTYKLSIVLPWLSSARVFVTMAELPFVQAFIKA